MALKDVIREAMGDIDMKDKKGNLEMYEEQDDDGKNEVTMSLRDYLKEHNKLIGRLSGNDDPALDAEADDQEKEVEDTLKEKKKKNPASIRGALKAAAEEKSED